MFEMNIFPIAEHKVEKCFGCGKVFLRWESDLEVGKCSEGEKVFLRWENFLEEGKC